MMMMNCSCGMVDRRKAFSLISSRDHCQRSSPSQISDTPLAGFEPAPNLSSGFVEWSWAVAITTTPRTEPSAFPIDSLKFLERFLSQRSKSLHQVAPRLEKIHSCRSFWPNSCHWTLPIPSKSIHCVKSVRIRSYSGPYFPAFGLNTERYSYLSVFSPNVGKCGPE